MWYVMDIVEVAMLEVMWYLWIGSRCYYKKIQAFIRKIPTTCFENKKGAVTVKPTRDPIVDENGKRRDILLCLKAKYELLRQLKSYIQESQKFQI